MGLGFHFLNGVIGGGAAPEAPTPTITAVSPSSISQWEPDTAIVVTGTNYSPYSYGRLDGVNLATTYQSPTQITCTVPEASLRTARTGILNVINNDSGKVSPDWWLSITAWAYTTPTEDLNPLSGNVLLNGSNITTLYNRGSAAGQFAMTTSATLQPGWLANDASFNNYPSIDFYGGRYMTNPNASYTSGIITTTAYTRLVVLYPRTAIANNATNYQNNGIYADTPAYTGVFLKNNSLALAYNWDGTDDAASTTIAMNAPTILLIRRGSGLIRVRNRLGTEVATATGATGNINTSPVLGFAPGLSSSTYDGRLGRLLTWSNEYTLVDSLRLMRWALHTYQIAA